MEEVRMSCLSHRCSVSLLNKSARSLSLSLSLSLSQALHFQYLARRVLRADSRRAKNKNGEKQVDQLHQAGGLGFANRQKRTCGCADVAG